MYFDVTKATYHDGYRIHLQFHDGSSGEVDLTGYVDPSNVFRAFLDKTYFQNFEIAYGTLTWGNGELDIAPETLYTLATGKAVSYRQHTSA